MDPTKWKKHASNEGTEYEIANYTLEGRGFFISYNGNEFLQRMNVKHGIPNTGMDSENPETALVVVPSAFIDELGHKMRHVSMEYLSRLIKTGRRSPWWFKAFNWIKDLCQREYFILRGDHRDAYEALVPKGLGACKAYFDAEAEKGNRHFFSN